MATATEHYRAGLNELEHAGALVNGPYPDTEGAHVHTDLARTHFAAALAAVAISGRYGDPLNPPRSTRAAQP